MSFISFSSPTPSGGGAKSPRRIKKSRIELHGYQSPDYIEKDAQKRTDAINANVRNAARRSSDLRFYSISGISYALTDRNRACLESMWGLGGVFVSKPLSIISTILTHCLNSPSIGNYFIRAECRGSRLNAAIKGLAPLSLPDSHPACPNHRLGWKTELPRSLFARRCTI